MAKIIVRQVRSGIGRSKKQNQILRGLGLRRIGMEREHDDNPVIRGMISKVDFLVEVREGK